MNKRANKTTAKTRSAAKRTLARRSSVKPKETQRDLLIEIGTEELPPLALANLSQVFENGIVQQLSALGFSGLQSRRYATPRRLAVIIKNLPLRQPDQEIERRGPAINAPEKAIEGFARSCNIETSQLQRLKTDKGEWFYYKTRQPGAETRDKIPSIVEEALAKLPIPKRMRWGSGSAEFVRPVHWVVLLFGKEAIEAPILGVAASNISYGHRFYHPKPIALKNPSEYESALKKVKVIVDAEERRGKIAEQVLATSKQAGGRINLEEKNALLDEVTALVEWPVPLLCRFDEHFLQVPAEALVSTMESNQRYFALYDKSGKLLPDFIVICNIESRDAARVREGNERVIRPRFADAAFFWEQDKKQPLESFNEKLKTVVFQNKLGTVYDKAARIAELGVKIARRLGEDEQPVRRAGHLSKVDLMSSMVGEFPKLQGIMGRYYALHAGEMPEVAAAIEEHYLPRHAGDRLPGTTAGQSLAIADRLDTLIGIFAAGLKPTGEKDPHGLRRAAIGVLKIMIEKRLDLDLRQLLQDAAAGFPDAVKADYVVNEVFEFVLGRLRSEYEDNAAEPFTPQQIEAVLSLKPVRPLDFDRRIRAVKVFSALPEAESLSAANKRIANILKKSGVAAAGMVEASLLQEAAERKLHAEIEKLTPQIEPLCSSGHYEAALSKLAGLRKSVDEFFDTVLVMAEDEAVKRNRLALLHRLHQSFTRIADIACLQT
ncbi:MAG TPA: glycine--tRNA ligase subunit beta [Gammaproteobacteria bacterium]|nr:glycine--tRNA ligase subunit beta [Gammaproteobacteria bacterium]